MCVCEIVGYEMNFLKRDFQIFESGFNNKTCHFLNFLTFILSIFEKNNNVIMLIFTFFSDKKINPDSFVISYPVLIDDEIKKSFLNEIIFTNLKPLTSRKQKNKNSSAFFQYTHM